MKKAQILFGFLLACIILIYLVYNQKLIRFYLSKELLISICFSFGILIASDMVVNEIVFLVLFVVIFSNVLIYSLLGIEEDIKFNLTSSLRYFKEQTVRVFLLVFSSVFILVSVFYIDNFYSISIVLISYFCLIFFKLYKEYNFFLKSICNIILILLIV